MESTGNTICPPGHYSTASRTLSKSLCFNSFNVLVIWQRLGPFARDLRESHKKASFSIVLENNPSKNI
jgi:hypothetical protein